MVENPIVPLAPPQAKDLSGSLPPDDPASEMRLERPLTRAVMLFKLEARQHTPALPDATPVCPRPVGTLRGFPRNVCRSYAVILRC